MTAGAVRVAELCKSYQDGAQSRAVLSGLSFEVRAGSTLSITGPSGSGKSTILNLLAGVLQPDAGSIELDLSRDGGTYALRMHEQTSAGAARVRRAHIGYVFQFFNLVPTLTVRENVLLPLELNRRMDLWPRSQARLAQLGLADRLDAFPDTLSGGERQRVAIARALAHDPDLVLADEPTGNLDVDNTANVADLLFDAVQEEGKTLIIATHNPEIAARTDAVLELA